jgi:hypothetical protein
MVGRATRELRVVIVGDADSLSRSLVKSKAELEAFGKSATSTSKDNDRLRRSWRDAETGLFDFGRASDTVGKKLNGGPLGLVGAIGSVSEGILKMGGFVQDGVSDLGKMSSEGEQAGGVMASLGGTLGSLAPVAGAATAGIAAIGAALLALPALAGVATFALVALLDTVTTLSAVVAAAAGPLGLLAGLLGGLGAAFVIAGKKALEGHGMFAHLARKVSDLRGQFAGLTRTLAERFLPYFWELTNAAQTALNYLGKIAKLPLNAALRSLSTEGVHLVNQFVYSVADALKGPFRLAVELAFGSRGENAQQAVSNWWDSMTDYLFGYTKTHPMNIHKDAIQMPDTVVAGALQPILDWFGRQHFTKTGIKWSNEIINGVIHGKGGHNIAAWASTIASHAGTLAGKAFMATLRAEITNLFPNLAGWFQDHLLVPGINVHPIFSAIRALWGQAKQKGEQAFRDVGTWAAQQFSGIFDTAVRWWNAIVTYIESHLPSLHIDIPGGGLLKAAGSVIPGATGGIVTGGIPGRDSVHTLLTPGEIVLTKRQQLSLLRGGPRRDVRDDRPITVNQHFHGSSRDPRAMQAEAMWNIRRLLPHGIA